jgi:hypothetical protein
LALCWAYQKRAFSVSGRFRKLLTDLINELRILKQRIGQITLFGELVPEEKFYVLGFVSAKIIALSEDVWFKKLEIERVALIQRFLDYN